jgi:hypothetical protein
LLTVFAEAFDRDADSQDFSMCAIIAHERGHQILARHPRISKRARLISVESEEILASIVGAMICDLPKDRNDLIAKAAGELLDYGVPAESTSQQIQHLWELLGALL